MNEAMASMMKGALLGMLMDGAFEGMKEQDPAIYAAGEHLETEFNSQVEQLVESGVERKRALSALGLFLNRMTQKIRSDLEALDPEAVADVRENGISSLFGEMPTSPGVAQGNPMSLAGLLG